MFSTPGHIIADPILTGPDARTLATYLGGLSGAALVAAIIGAVIGYALACKIDWLPAIWGVAAGIAGVFVVLGVVPA
jgi:hypothetical protein